MIFPPGSRHRWTGWRDQKRSSRNHRTVSLSLSLSLSLLLVLNLLALAAIFQYAQNKVVEPETRIPLRDELISTYPKRYFGAHEYWKDILTEGQNLNQENSGSVLYDNVVEVGANNAKDALYMAEKGFQTHSFEPSPPSFQNIKGALQAKSGESGTENIFIYNYAVGDTDGETVLFENNPSTGAHVVSEEDASGTDVARVPTISIDKFLEGGVAPDFTTQKSPVAFQQQSKIYAAKVDVQGFEPFVFRGMKKVIQERRIPYIMTEWWPRGIETGGGNFEKKVEEKCELAMETMHLLHDAGYVLFATPLEAHPRLTDANGLQHIKLRKMNRRFDDLREDCLGIYDLEEKFPFTESNTYGYWTDVIAVSPDAPLPKTLMTNFGKGIQKYFSTMRKKWENRSYTCRLSYTLPCKVQRTQWSLFFSNSTVFF